MSTYPHGHTARAPSPLYRLLCTSAVALAALAATVACGPTAATHATPPVTSTGPGLCPPGWVCGTCRDGSWWKYLDDPQIINHPPMGGWPVNPQHPCG